METETPTRLAAASLPETAVSQIPDLVARRQDALRALEQTRAERRSGNLRSAGERALAELEKTLTGAPEEGPEGTISVRVVAAPERARQTPAVPLADLGVRVKLKDRVVAEAVTDAAGLAELTLDSSGAGTVPVHEANYELEILGPDCSVIACQRGSISAKRPAPVHRFEVGRTPVLQAALERARPIEQGLLQARARAALAASVIDAALAAQEKRLREHPTELDAVLSRGTASACAEAGIRLAESPASDLVRTTEAGPPAPDPSDAIPTAQPRVPEEGGGSAPGRTAPRRAAAAPSPTPAKHATKPRKSSPRKDEAQS